MALHYQITVKECLENGWSDWFDSLTITPNQSGTNTTLTGEVRDQTALYGLIAKLRDLGLTLVAVVPCLAVTEEVPSAATQPPQ